MTTGTTVLLRPERHGRKIVTWRVWAVDAEERLIGTFTDKRVARNFARAEATKNGWEDGTNR